MYSSLKVVIHVSNQTEWFLKKFSDIKFLHKLYPH